MTGLKVVTENPSSPPVRFQIPDEDYEIDRSSQSAWRRSTVVYAQPHGFSGSASRDARTLESFFQAFGIERPVTSSYVSVAESLFDRRRAEKRSTSVNEYSSYANVCELRKLTGFSWERLGQLLNVDRRTIYNWLKSSEIRDANRIHIAQCLSVLRFADRGSASANRAMLDSVFENGLPVFSHIRNRRYEDARRLLGYGKSTPRLALTAAPRDHAGNATHGMLMHADADGFETIEPLPNEPEPASRKRLVRRD